MGGFSRQEVSFSGVLAGTCNNQAHSMRDWSIITNRTANGQLTLETEGAVSARATTEYSKLRNRSAALAHGPYHTQERRLGRCNNQAPGIRTATQAGALLRPVQRSGHLASGIVSAVKGRERREGGERKRRERGGRGDRLARRMKVNNQ